MNKKSIGALLLSAALLVGASGATFAYFTDTQVTETQNITLGNVKVAFTPTSGNTNWTVLERDVMNISEALTIDPVSQVVKDYLNNGYDDLVYGTNSISHVAPGDFLAKAFTLKNVGTLDAKVRFSLDQIKVGTEDAHAKLLKPNNIHFKAYALNADNKPGKEIEVGVDAEGKYILDATTGESIIVYALMYIDSSMDNGGQDKNINFVVKAEATQWNNQGWKEDGSK